jgi:hypothetical protein
LHPQSGHCQREEEHDEHEQRQLGQCVVHGTTIIVKGYIAERTRRGTAYRKMMKRYSAKAALEREHWRDPMNMERPSAVAAD